MLKIKNELGVKVSSVFKNVEESFRIKIPGKMKKSILILSVAAAVLGLLLSCPTYRIVRSNGTNEGLIFFYVSISGESQYCIGISPDDDEVKMLYESENSASYRKSGIALDEGTLYITDYCRMMDIHDGMFVIDNTGEQISYLKTLSAPIGVAVAGDYLVVGSGTWYPPDFSSYYMIYNKDTLEEVRGPVLEQDILWGNESVHEYDDGIILVLSNHQVFTDGKIQYLSGEGMEVQKEWSVETYPFLENHRSLYSYKDADSLTLASTYQLTIADIPLPLGSGEETVIDLKPLLGISVDNLTNEQTWQLVSIGVTGDEYIGYVGLSASNRAKLFKLNLKTGKIVIMKDLDNPYLNQEQPAVTPATLISNNKLYTESFDEEGWDEKAIGVFSLDDFSFIKKIWFDETEARSLIAK